MNEKRDYKLIGSRFGLYEELRSERGVSLLLDLGSGHGYDKPLLTVELHSKWYELYLIERWEDADKTKWLRLWSIHFGHLDDVCPDDVSAFVDHVPNPLCVRLFAARNDYLLPGLTDEIITGRWQTDVVDQNVMQCDRCEGVGVVEVLNHGTAEPSHLRCRACKGHGVLKPDTR